MVPSGFSVGDATIDAQHKELFELIEGVLVNVEKGAHDETIAGALDFLGRYVDCHLAHEESYMKAHEYPDLENHLKWHERFREAYRDLRDSHRNGKNAESLDNDIRLFVRNWWYKHILIEDHRYHEYISANGGSHPPNESPDYHTTINDVC